MIGYNKLELSHDSMVEIAQAWLDSKCFVWDGSVRRKITVVSVGKDSKTGVFIIRVFGKPLSAEKKR